MSETSKTAGSGRKSKSAGKPDDAEVVMQDASDESNSEEDSAENSDEHDAQDKESPESPGRQAEAESVPETASVSGERPPGRSLADIMRFQRRPLRRRR